MTLRDAARTVILIGLCQAAILSPRAQGQEEETGTSGEASVGLQALDEDPHDSAKFSEYREVPRGFLAEYLLLRWTPKPLLYFDVEAVDIAQKDTRGTFQFGRRDLWKGALVWKDNPRRWGDDTETLYAQQGDATFTLDDTLQFAVQGAPASADTSPADGQWDTGTKGFLIKRAIDQSGQPVFLGYQRRTLGAGFEITPTRNWTVSGEWSRERRDGTTPQSLGMYFALSPSEVAAPIDYRTDWESAGVEYAHRNWNLGVQLAASQFETRYDTLTWDNQLSLVDQGVTAGLTSIPGHGRLTLGVDNDMMQGTVYGGVNLPGRTRIDATFSRSETTQDDPFLPMTINGNLAPLLDRLPATDLDGKHRTLLANVRVASRPLDWFRWSAWARQHELKNDSRSLIFPEYVQTDYAIPLCTNLNACDDNNNGALDDRIQRRNLPFAWEKDNYGALAGFSPARWADFSLSYERQDMKREFSAVEDSSENIYALSLNLDFGDWLTIRSASRVQKRRADEYDVEYYQESFPIGEPFIAPLNEGSRRFIWTDRDRNTVNVFFEVSPSEKWSIYGEGTYAEDEYFDPVTGKAIGESFTISEDRNFDGTPETINLRLVGRTFDRSRTHTLGVAFTPGPRFDLFVDYTWEDFKYRLAQRYRAPAAGIGSDNPLDDWGSNAHDTYQTTSLGFNVRLDRGSYWNLGVTGSRSEGKGDISTDFTAGGQASGDTTLTQFPQLDTVLTIATLALTHRIRPNWDYTVRYWYEKWDEANFAGDLMQPYMGDPGNDPGSVTSIYLGMDFDNYTANVLSLVTRYRW